MTAVVLKTFLSGLGAAFVTLVVHEIGHLLAGLAVGFRFSLFAMGPLLVERSPTGAIRPAWNREPGLFGGAAATLPVDTDSLRRRFATVVAGGPCASALLAIGAALALPHVQPPHGLIHLELSWLRLLSAAVFVGTVMPVPNGPFVTDGLRFLRIVKPGAVGERELGLLTITAAEQAGRRPRDWDAALIRRGLAVRDGSIFECQLHLYAYRQALDSGALDAARVALDQAVALARHLPDALRTPCLVEAAYVAAAHDDDPARARGLLDEIRPGTGRAVESDLLRAQAAIALAEGDMRSAKEILGRAAAKSPPWATGPRAWLTALGQKTGLPS